MSNPSYIRSPLLLDAQQSRLLIVDMQERLLKAMVKSESIVAKCHQLLTAAQLLDVPAHATEQYPKGLGPTASELNDFFTERPEKLRFSSAEVLDWVHEDRTSETRHQIVLAGIETHICVLQTAFDLLAAGFDVYLVSDATTSRQAIDHDIALKRIADAGGTIVTTEMVLFEWCEVAGTDEFKAISKLVTE